jgi:hypothetical protein
MGNLSFNLEDFLTVNIKGPEKKIKGCVTRDTGTQRDCSVILFG